jgi:hypothetical protein
MTISGEPMAKKGRKPKGEFTRKLSHFSTRIQPETREALEKEAKATGQSVSQVAERLLRQGLSRKDADDGDRAARAICFLIRQIARFVVGIELLRDGRSAVIYDWRSDPFFYRAFKLAVSRVLDALEPAGKIKQPVIKLAAGDTADDKQHYTEMRKTFATPEARAQDTADLILAMLTTKLSGQEREAQRQHLIDQGVSPAVFASFYGMPEAADDLKVREYSGKKVQINALVNITSWSTK